MGRALSEPEGALRFAWSGTTLSVRFGGPSLAVDIQDAGENRFCVVVDGALREPKLAPGPGRKMLTLAADLGAGEHELTLVRLTEAMLGETCVFGFHAPLGRFYPPPPAQDRRIELIGDSISAGYGNEAPAPECSFSATHENHYQSYGAISARALGAELVTLAWSGKGVFSNCGSVSDRATMPVLWRRTLPSRAHSRWDFGQFRPHAVVVNLGTNDLSPHNPDQAPFAEAYLSFVRELRACYPEAFIVCSNGPLLSDAWPERAFTLTRAREGIAGAVEALREAGDARIAYLEFDQVRGDEGFGADYHPSLRTHERMAGELTRALREQLGW